MKTLPIERMIVRELRWNLRNDKIKVDDIQEWSTSEKAIDENIRPDEMKQKCAGVFVAVKKSLDRSTDLRVGAFYCQITRRNLNDHYHWEIKKVKKQLPMKDVPKVWHDDSLLFWESEEKMIEWANNNKHTQIIGIDMKKISELILSKKK